MAYRRYAIYFAPRPGTALARFGAGWFGRDVETGQDCARLTVPGFDGELLDELTAQPARYGFHGTLKAPFPLADERSPADLFAAVDKLAANARGCRTQPLVLTDLDGFLALCPKRPSVPLTRLALRCVRTFDRFRAPMSASERARRLSGGLSARQRELLDQWGYPFVADEFRFHLTLTRRLEPPLAAKLDGALREMLAPVLAERFLVEDLCVFGEAEETGRFRLLHRAPLRPPRP